MLLWMQIKQRREGRQGAAGADYRDPAPPRLDVSAPGGGRPVARFGADHSFALAAAWCSRLPASPGPHALPAERRRAAAATRRDGRTD
jgi:hypothetical protein